MATRHSALLDRLRAILDPGHPKGRSILAPRPLLTARRVVFTLLLAGLAAGVLDLVVWGCRTSPYPAMVALKRAYGGPFSLGEVEIGLHSSVLRDLQLFEPDAQPGDPPWAVAGEAEADLAAWGLLNGVRAPTQVVVRQGTLTLRFDRLGHLLTRFPQGGGRGKALPAIVVEQATVVIRQEGRPDFAVTGVSATLEPEGGTLNLTGTVCDPRWGSWDLKGTLDPAARSGSGTLSRADEIYLTEEMLEELPFVSPKVWKHVHLEGSSPVELSLRVPPGGTPKHYRVVLAPEQTRVHVVDVDLDAEQAHGQVTIEDGIVHLVDVQGNVAQGTLQTSAAMYFRTVPPRLEFDVAVQKLDLRHLPRKWPMPPGVEGKLSGQARLEVAIVDGKAKTTGQGMGQISEAKLFGISRTKPIGLKLRADQDGFHFGLMAPTAPNDGPMTAPARHAPSREKP
jgi:hypothetical protein